MWLGKVLKRGILKIWYNFFVFVIKDLWLNWYENFVIILVVNDFFLNWYYFYSLYELKWLNNLFLNIEYECGLLK